MRGCLTGVMGIPAQEVKMLFKSFSISMPVRRLHLGLGCLIAGAWALLVIWQNSPYAGLLGHEALEDHHRAKAA